MKRRLAIVAFVTLATLTPVAVSALSLQPIVPSDCNNSGGCSSICDIATAAQNALDDGIYIAIFLSAILFAWAGWEVVIGSSAGNETQLHHGKDIFKYVAGGLVLILSAWIIVSVIMSVLTTNSSWNSLCNSSAQNVIQNVGS